MNNEEAIKFGKEQLEIFGEDSQMSEFIRLAIQAFEAPSYEEGYNRGYAEGLSEGVDL